ncbi:MAG: hypothetical protein MUD08_18565, partial [Cytophagales bacterium]|nr:hypothetical protein [Cytophagales bacterium]
MKPAYNTAWLDARRMAQYADVWHRRKLMTDEQREAIRQAYPDGFYNPNVFIRIGLGFFCYILLAAAQGLVWLMVGLSTNFSDDGLLSGVGLLTILLGGGCMLLLEATIRQRHHYAAGLDDILLYAGIGQVLGGVFMMAPDLNDPLPYLLVSLPALAFGAVRYLDRLLTALAFFCGLSVVLLIVAKVPSIALYLLPFAGMFSSAAVYYLARRGLQRTDLRHWDGCLRVLEVLGSVFFYMSGNYWVIANAAGAFFGLPVVPLGWFFWIFTFAVPAAALYFGIRRKDRVLLWLGLGFVAAALATFRAYFHVIPLAVAATLGGAVLFAVAYFSIRFLKKGRPGYTYEPDRQQEPFLGETESLVVAQAFSGTVHTPDQGVPAGGGR